MGKWSEMDRNREGGQNGMELVAGGEGTEQHGV